MKKRFRKLQAIVLSLALVLGSVSWQDAPKAAAAVAAPEEGLDSKKFSLSSDNGLTSDDSKRTGSDYDGYIMTLNAGDYDGEYFKVTYSVDPSACTSETEIFNFQPFDESWGGWQNNKVTFGDSELDTETNKYVAFLSIEDIENSYTGSKALLGINISFMAATPSVTFEGLELLYKKSQDQTAEESVTISGDMGDGNGHETLQVVTASAIIAAYENDGDDSTNITLENITSGNASVYVHITQSSPYSRLKISGGNISNPKSPKSSNKELIGRKCTTSTNTSYILHSGYRTTGGYGSGQGVKESGNYVFPSNGMNKQQVDETTQGVLLRRMTTDVDGYIIGIVFGSGKSVSLDEEGNITPGFNPADYNLESQTLDDSDYSDEELDELYAEEAEAAVTSMEEMYEDGLGNAITDCEFLDEESFTAESWAKLETALEDAYEVYDAGYKDMSETSYSEKTTYCPEKEAEFKAARDALMKVRVALVPIKTTDPGSPKAFRVLTKSQVIAEMGSGINLGNTMDGHSAGRPSETSWQAAKTTKEYIEALHDAGYNTVRVPVTWGDMIDDEEDYAIDEVWMNRVQEIVDYCIDLDMYCIINIHHDGAANHSGPGSDSYAWLNTAATDISYVYEKFAGTWRNIAERFKDYDEHLIFESMNEVTDDHTTNVHTDTEVLNNLNQIYINAVRATGSNNTKRWLAITGRFATANEGVTKPADPLDDAGSTTRMMFAVHIYKNMHNTKHSYNDTLKTWQNSMSSTKKRVDGLDPEMPIYVGEYGNTQQVLEGSATGYNNIERAMAVEGCSAIAKFYGACPIVWDQGAGDYSTAHTETGIHSYWNRVTLKPTYDNLVHGMIRGEDADYSGMNVGDIMSAIYTSYGHASTSDTSIATDVEVTEITEITVDDSVTMKAGERTTLTATVTPEENNDVVIWSSDDDSVATVYKGMIHAKKAGITTIRAYSQSGSVEKEISLVVSTSGNETATAITTDKAYYEIEVGSSDVIRASLTPADSEDAISYRSSNPEVASVNSNGIITANRSGTTYITVSAASGVTTIVKVKVPSVDPGVDVALHAYYNSGDMEGDPITITEDGQYSVTFDAEEAGVDSINDVVSIYIKDCNAANPVVESANIRYDKIVVDGVELTITNTDFKSAIKANGQFDTNDPINGWDGCAVDASEVTINGTDHTVSFNGFDAPQKITVTFTIQDLTFFPTSEKENEATEMSIEGENILKMDEAGDTVQIPISLVPEDTDSFVTAYSTDSSVAAVDCTALAVDENGMVTLNVTAVGEGTAIITAITENGLKLFFSIGVGDVEVSEPTDPTPEGLEGGSEEIEPTTSPGTEPSTAPTESQKPSESANPTESQKPSGSTAPSESAAPTASTAPSASTAPTGTTPPSDSSTGVITPTDNYTTSIGKAVNEEFEDGSFKYSVMKAATQTIQNGQVISTTDAEVCVVALTAKGMKAKKLTIAESVTVDNVKYVVTSLKAGIFAKAKKATQISLKKATGITTLPASAFKNAKTVKKITLNKNITEISKSAFAGCKKLNALVIPATLKKVQKNAFKGCKSKIKVTGGNAKAKKANIKLLKKSGYKKFK